MRVEQIERTTNVTEFCGFIIQDIYIHNLGISKQVGNAIWDNVQRNYILDKNEELLLFDNVNIALGYIQNNLEREMERDL
jgi:hypothetical protein